MGNVTADCINTTSGHECTCKAPYWEGDGMDGDDGSAGCNDIDERAVRTHDCVSFYGADEKGITPNASTTMKVSLAIAQLVSLPKKTNVS